MCRCDGQVLICQQGRAAECQGQQQGLTGGAAPLQRGGCADGGDRHPQALPLETQQPPSLTNRPPPSDPCVEGKVCRCRGSASGGLSAKEGGCYGDT